MTTINDQVVHLPFHRTPVPGLAPKSLKDEALARHQEETQRRQRERAICTCRHAGLDHGGRNHNGVCHRDWCDCRSFTDPKSLCHCKGDVRGHTHLSMRDPEGTTRLEVIAAKLNGDTDFLDALVHGKRG